METVQVIDRAVARVRTGAPWVWRTDVLAVPQTLPSGSVRVTDRRGRFLGSALYSTRSPIALRLYSSAELEFDEPLLRERLAACRTRRHRLFGDGVDAYRLVHGDADGIPGLLVDRYGDLLVVQLLCEALAAREALVLSLLERIERPAAIVLRNDGSGRDFEGLPREAPRLERGDTAVARYHEGSLLLEIDAMSDAKTGAFLDQRENHLAVRAYVRAGLRALDAFTYHGGFALQLASAGASVLAIDESAAAIGRARANAERAGLSIEFRQANAFDELGRLEASGARFDLVVIDPPALAKRKGALVAAERAYYTLNLRAMRLVAEEGILVTCSCSGRIRPEHFAAILEKAAGSAQRTVQLLEKRGAGRDHPERLGLPESAYLKCWICRVL